jgi:carbohydrate diacid regulator
LSVKLLQAYVNQIKDIIEPEFGIMDETGLVLACSDESKAGSVDPHIQEVLEAKDQSVVVDGNSYYKMHVRNNPDYIIYLASDRSESFKYLFLISVNLANMKLYHDEKFDKGNLIRDILNGAVQPGDIALKARELHIAYNAYRTVFFIKTEKTRDMHSYEVIQSLFPNRAKDFIIIIDDERIALVRELKSEEDFKEIEKTARIIIDTLSMELLIKTVIGIGTPVDTLGGIECCYREAQTALAVGSIFDSDRPITYYNNMGIGRLIYQLPMDLCRVFLKEVFKEEPFESLDSETLMTIQKFFENDLNVSETSRQLYVHRNTLVYRLDKIQKMTGLDLTKFDDAIIFKVSMLVKKYLDRLEKEST